MKDNTFFDHFTTVFKTFCGGGESEEYIACAKLASDKLVARLFKTQYLSYVEREAQYNSSSDSDNSDDENYEEEVRRVRKEISEYNGLNGALPYCNLEQGLVGVPQATSSIGKPRKPLFSHLDISKIDNVSEKTYV
jgi:hypothetical protein